MTSRRITVMRKVFGQVTGAQAEGLLPSTCLPGGARLVGGGAKLIALSSFEFVMAAARVPPVRSVASARSQKLRGTCWRPVSTLAIVLRLYPRSWASRAWEHLAARR